jgi:hypothetical protein
MLLLRRTAASFISRRYPGTDFHNSFYITRYGPAADFFESGNRQKEAARFLRHGQYAVNHMFGCRVPLSFFYNAETLLRPTEPIRNLRRDALPIKSSVKNMVYRIEQGRRIIITQTHRDPSNYDMRKLPTFVLVRQAAPAPTWQRW